ncbi:MAG: glutamate--tRNA ligase [Anaerolineae bacterium]|nr:glutamate--tRNA ligase [Anaerolineae bacterium]
MDFNLDSLFPARSGLPSHANVVKVDLQDRPHLALQDAFRAAIAYRWAQQSNGLFILHLDNTDPEPLFKDNLIYLLNMLSGLGTRPDEFGDLGQHGPYSWADRRQLSIQEHKVNVYQEVIAHLLESGWAYPCFTQPYLDADVPFDEMSAYQERCRNLSQDELEDRLGKEPCVIRFRVPSDITLEYTDPVYGDLSFDTNEMEDFVLVTPDGLPMPCLAHVVDNHYMRASVQVRRSSALAMVPHEILLSKALVWDMPMLVHVPTIHDPLASPFEEASVGVLEDRGYRPETLRNFLVQLGLVEQDNRSYLTRQDILQSFNTSTLPNNPVTIDYELLDRIQGGYTWMDW